MLVVVAGRHDREARRLVERWSGRGAGLLTCEDLSVEGWQYRLDDPEGSIAVVGGEPVTAGEITGVLTRLPHVPERELPWIAREDRPYVATEMTAFLRSWLSSLGCPVLNRPAPTCLSGPGWCQEQWILAAARFGIPVRPVRRQVAQPTGILQDDPAAPDITATVVDDSCLGPVDDALAAWARRLARAAEVDLLAVHFGSTEKAPKLLGADPWPDVSRPEVSDAILEYLCQGGKC